MRLLVIDTETTGLYPDRYQMITLGMVLIEVDENSLEIIDQAHIFFGHDEYNVSRTAMRVNGIDIEEHKKIAVPVPVAIKQTNEFLEKHELYATPILGHNVHFDQRFIRATFEDYGKAYPFFEEKLDTRYIWERLKKAGKVNPFYDAKLGTLSNHFGFDYSKAHDAIEDCILTAKCYHEILKLLEE